MPQLGVNIDHVATLREARRTFEPDPVSAAHEAQLGGASCITFHLRKDRRHIQDRDMRLLKEMVTVKLNMEMSLDPEIVDLAAGLRPEQATLVPENRQEVTTEGGLDTVAQYDRFAEAAARLMDVGVEVSAFIDPVREHIDAAAKAGCKAIEIHTGAYANAFVLHPGDGRDDRVGQVLGQIRDGLAYARSLGLVVHGGHGLTYANVGAVAAMDGFCEFNIGHSIVSRAVFVGLRQAVAGMLAAIRQGASGQEKDG
jgi:pyridoxine 5-phosphate synthase